MPIEKFPDPESANSDGLVAVGGDLSISSLKLAYSNGIFPWPFSETGPLPWFSPDPRGVLYFEDLKIPKSLKKFLAKNDYKVSFNQDFPAVIRGCAQSKNRKEGNGTWITKTMIESYIDFHFAGYAFSVEVYNSENTLVGGLYGTHIGRMVCGESMFFLEPNTSKLALLSLIDRLQGKGISWLDTQMVTPVVQSLGGKEISRKEFLQRLRGSIRAEPGFILFPK